jgi:hypothetical protein
MKEIDYLFRSQISSQCRLTSTQYAFFKQTSLVGKDIVLKIRSQNTPIGGIKANNKSLVAHGQRLENAVATRLRK